MNPDKYTIKEFFIEVGNGHQLYVCEWGNKKARPIFSLHGGPGSSTKDRHKAVFDPAVHHVVFFDQRGCGKSTPTGSIQHNTTPDLINDISAIADHLGHKDFSIYAQSWGAALALAYAVAHPKRVRALMLGSVFSGSQPEIDWVDKGEFKSFFPEVWECFLERTPANHHSDPSAYHHKNIVGNDEQLIRTSGLAVEEMEHSLMRLDDRTNPIDPVTFDPSGVRIYSHYMLHGCFMPDQHILKNAHKLTMPIWIVHGRFDMVCPPQVVYELDKKLPNSQLIWATSNHSNEHENFTLLRTILLNNNQIL